MIHALVHTQGVVLGNIYVALELAYADVLGVRAHFHIPSPLPYATMRRFYPHARPDALVITQGGTPYSEVLQFLERRSRSLTHRLGRPAVFGYKGLSYQPRVLRDAGLSPIVNIERWGVPKLQITDEACPWHTGPRSKCAAAALNQILRSHAATRFFSLVPRSGVVR